MLKRIQTPKEEHANTISHAIGLVLGLISIPFLIKKALAMNEVSLLFGAASFSLGIVMVYSFSTLYHSSKNPKSKNKLQILDHISIYFLIAGSYTPMILAILKPAKAFIFLSILWGSVMIGSFFKIFFTGRFKILSVSLYLLMGWMALFFREEVFEKISLETLNWIAIGGISYTIGVYFYVKSNKLYFHSIWHIFVLIGTICHFLAVYQLY